MSNASVTSTASRKKRSWLRIVCWALSIIVVLGVAAYFVVTSSAFFKGVVLPKVGAALNASVTVGDASISPFHEVVLRNFSIRTTGTEPLVVAPEVRLRYSLMDILSGKIHVDDFTVSSPAVVLIQNADGTSNLDPILKAQSAKVQQERPQEPVIPSAPMQVELLQLAFKDASFRRVKHYKNGNQDVAELSHVNVTVANVKNGQTGTVEVSANINANNNPPPPGTNALLQATLKGKFTFALTADLRPSSVQGNTRVEVTRAEGAMAQMAAFAASLDCDVSPTDIKQVALRFQKGDAKLGELLIHGPFDLKKAEGRLTVEIQNIDKQLLNLAGGANGLDFGSTSINSTNEIQLDRSASLITATGQFNLNHLEVTRTGQTTPPLDLHADYNVIVDRAASNAVLRTFNLAGNQRGAKVLHAGLTSPMTIAWGNTANLEGDSTLDLAISRLELGDWKPFLGDAAPAGEVSAKLKLISQQAGEKLTFDLETQVANLTARAGSNQISQATVSLTLRGEATAIKQFSLPEYKLQVAHQNQPLVSVSGSANYNRSTQAADVQLTAQLVLARLLQAMPCPHINVSSGTADLRLHITQTAQPAVGSASALSQSATGSFKLTDFTGSAGSNSFRNFGLAADLDAGITAHEIQIRKFQIALSPTARGSNLVQLTGHIDMTRSNAYEGNLKLAADSLDLTTYYDLFGERKETPAQQPAPASASASSGPQNEPEATQLPLHNFIANATVRRLYLHEIEIADFQATAKIDRGRMTLNPFKLSLNGAPVNSTLDLDLGVPGYRYDFSFSALAVPLAPLVNSFQPERKGILSGTATAEAKVKGAGITGASLQKNLSGEFNLNSTNLNLAVSSIKGDSLYTKGLKAMLDVITAIPDLAKNPAGTVMSLLGGAASGSGSSSGLTPELKKSPINAIIMRGNIGSGRVDLQQATVQSPAFEAGATGTITFAEVLSNSVLNIPVSVSLERSVAQRINLAGSTPTNAAYAKLPDFLTEKGTLGNPKLDINKVALAAAVLQQVGGKSGEAGGLLQGLGGILARPAPAPTNAPPTTTSQPPTNQNPVGNLLNQFLQPKKK